MPTFDFANIVRKIISTAVAVVSSPVSAVLVGAAALTPLASEIIAFFPNIILPTVNISVPNLASEGNQYLSLFLYAVHFDLAVDMISKIFHFLSSLITFLLGFLVSLTGIIISVGCYRVVRSALKDYAS